MFDLPPTVDPTKKPPTRRKRRIPRSATPAMFKMVTGLIYVLLFAKFSSAFYPDVLIEPEFLQYGFLRRVFILHMVGLTARFKYYGVWTLTEGACILSGLGYNGVDPVTGKVRWDRLVNIKPLGVELAQNTRAYLGNWNINTSNWLRNYVYLRVTPRGKKPGFRASLATFTTSAFWHGFYPGYYLSFVLASFIQTIAKNFRRNLRPFFLDPKTQAPLPSKKYYDIFSLIVTQLTFSFVAAPFLILSFSGSLLVWSRVYFYAVIGTVASMAFFASPAKKSLRKMLEARAAKAGVVVTVSADKDKKTGGTTTKVVEIKRSGSTDSLQTMPVLGVSQDLERELDEAIGEIKSEMEARGLGKEKIEKIKVVLEGKKVE